MGNWASAQGLHVRGGHHGKKKNIAVKFRQLLSLFSAQLLAGGTVSVINKGM